MTELKDLTLKPPRSPRNRLHGYVILARTIDKCLAVQSGTAGDYHFDCPLDKQLFTFKGISAEDFNNAVKFAQSDEDIAAWVDQNGIAKTPAEIQAWSEAVENYYPYQDPERREWFEGECRILNLDPQKTSLFDYLEADDAVLGNQALDH